MEARKKTSLKRNMVVYFLVVALANIVVGIELLVDIGSNKYRTSVIEQVSEIKNGDKPETSIFSVLDRLTRKFIIMDGILILVSAVVLFLFVVQIASPIQYMINVAKKIAGGDLSVNLNMKSKDEIADLGNLINDLTVNLQEIIVQLQKMHASFEEAYTCLELKLSVLPELQRHFQLEQRMIKDNVDSISMIKQSFTVYQMRKFTVDDLTPMEEKLLNDLRKANEITQEQSDVVRDEHKKRGGYVGAILRELEYVDNTTLLKYITSDFPGT